MNVAVLIEEFKLRGVALWVNGDRLGYRSPKGVLTQEDLAALRSHKDEILAHLREANAIRHDADSRYESFPMTDIQRAYATGQHSGYELGGTGCHSYAELRMPRLDRERLEAAWHGLIQRHDMLSAVVIPPDSLRIVPAENGPVLQEIDLRGHDPESPDEVYLRYRRELEEKSYPLGAWPLHEFRILQFDDCSILQFSVDMIIADFVSVRVMVEELLSLYEGRPLAPLPEVTFRDIVVSRAAWRDTPAGRSEYDSAREYWLGALDSMHDKPSLPLERMPRAEADGPVRFTRRTWKCPAHSWAALVQRAAEHGVTPSNVLLTAYTDVIRRWSSSPEFCVNVTSINRGHDVPDVDRVLGDFTEVSVHACHPHPGPFVERVRNTQQRLFEELSHSIFSGVAVLRELGRAKGESAIVPIVFTGALGAGLRRDGGQDFELVYGVSRTPQVWIDCQAFEDAQTCNVNWDVREGTVPSPVLEAMWESFTDALERLCADAAVWQHDDIVRLGERTRAVRAQIHQTEAELATVPLQAGFWEQVQHRPDHTAMVCSGESYTYRELAGYVQTLDARLSHLGQGDRVAIVLGKGVWQVAAALAVVSRGAVYVPIDHDQPPARQHRMAAICRPRAIIADGAYSAADGEPEVINVDGLSLRPWDGCVPAPTPVDDPAYIIFTSGSTGTPKGVVMTHAAAMNTITDINQRFGNSTARTVLGLSKLSFDLSVYDIFGTFASGGTLVLPAESEARDPSKWVELMRASRVDTWNSVPALFQMLLREREAAGLSADPVLQVILLSGDLIPRTLPAQAVPHFPSATLISLGGATEAGIWSIYHPMTDHVGEENIPYGRALSNQRMYVLDEFLNECPDGVKGKIHIAGDSLATEYFDDPETTRQKFFFSPKQNCRVYDTGDLGSYRHDGIIEFHGRVDNQVKINGYRVETGEIESILESCENIGRAVVVMEDADGRKKLRAFVTPAGEDAATAPVLAPERQNGMEALATALAQRWESGDTHPGPGATTYAAWMKAGNEASLAALLAAFTGAGVFLQPGIYHREGEIAAKMNPDSEYQRLVARWLDILVAEGVLLRGPEGFSITRESLDYFRMDERWDQFAALEEKVHNSATLFGYQRHAASTLLSQLRGEVNPVDLFFPGGETGNARAIYGENRISDAINAAVSEAVAGIVEKRGDRPLRIIEVGAGVGATTEHIVPRLPATVAEYRFTDISTFFLRNAREAYREYGFMTYGLFDLNTECGEQDVELGAYDVIICANVLHNAVNIDETFARLNQLRRTGGVIVMIEPVTELYAALISISIKMSLVDFTDLRAGTHRVFIEDREWDGVFSRAGLSRIAEFPPEGHPLRECGQRLLVVSEAGASGLDEDQLMDFLRENLPGYMVPASISVLDAVPLSPNGKVDRKALTRSYTGGHASAGRALSQPHGGMEEEIAAVWRDVLEVDQLGRDEDFYAAGGDSLLMAQAVTRMRQEVAGLKDQSWDFIMREMLKHPTVAGIAKAAGGIAAPGNTATKAPATPAVAQRLHVYGIPENSTTCRVMFHAGTGRIKDYDLLVPALMEKDPHIAHVGFTSGDADEYLASPIDELIAERARRYAQDLLDLNMDSYELVGYCIGGFFAIETAKVLAELGQEVSRVVAVSTHLCPHRIANELLCEFAYACVVESDLPAAGVSFGFDLLHDGLSDILQGVNRDISDDELCALGGKYAPVGSFFSEQSRLSPRQRRRRFYETIEGFDANSDSARAMLEILYDVFRHSLRGTIGYVPDVYFGKVLVLQPELGVQGFYPSLGGDVDWPGTVLGELQTGTVSGCHATCLTEENYRSVLRYFE